jgi:hypothetical protein|tara:strand:- start:336 stop:575 length:240 start_codon:yes stop_codon:yes gene_type:complete
MFITDIAIENANEALKMTKRALEIEGVAHSILGLDTMGYNVCEFVATWAEGADRQTKQAKINVVLNTFELLTEYHKTDD